MFRRILIIIGYALVGLAIAAATLALVAYGQGYSYDFSTHRLVHKGLVMIDASPGGAIVTRPGSSWHHAVAYHGTYKPGTYTFTVSKTGYRSWSKTLTVTAGQVVDARYVVLLPQKLVNATAAKLNGTLGTAVVSSNHQSLAVPVTTPSGVDIYIADLPGGNFIKRLSLPGETITQLVWSADATHLLVVSQAPTGPVDRVISADGSVNLNLTTQYNSTFPGLKFDPTNWQQLYWVDSTGALRHLDLSAQAISGVLAAGISQFSFAGNRLIYVQATSLGQSLMAFTLGNPTQPQQLIQALPKSPGYVLKYANYQGQDELVVIPNSTGDALVYTGIFGSSPVSTIVARNVTSATFSPDGHYVALYSPSLLITYDFLLSTPTQIINYPSPNLGGSLQGLNWFDNNHLLLNINGQTVFSDFDGTNRTIITSTLPNSLPFGALDQKSIYSLQATTTGQKLVNTSIR